MSIIRTRRIDKAARIIMLMMAMLALLSLNGCFFRPANSNNQTNTPDVSDAPATDDEDQNTENGGLFSNNNKPEHLQTNQASPEAPTDVDELTQVDKRLIGQWASHSFGQINGASTSDDELITFKKDGTFTDVIVMSGPLMEGTLKIQGSFEADEDAIYFYDCTESWDPSPGSSTEKQAYENQAIEDYESEYEFADDQTINISYLTYEKVK